MPTPYERLRERISSIPREVLDRVDRNLNDPGYVPEPVDWREDPDPLGRDWDWIEPTSSESNVEAPPRTEDRRDPPATIPFASPASPPWKTAVLWASSLAASLIVGAVGYRALTTSSVRPALREQPMAAWVGPEVGVGADGAAIAAGPDDGRDRPPIVTNIGRPEDMKPPASPSVYAPNRIQEQLVVPEARPGAAGVGRSIRSVQEAVRPGAIYYLELSAAGAASPGTAVVIRTEPRPWGLLEDEASVSPDDGTTYYGPLRMGDEEAEYLVVLADRRDEPLAAVVSSAGPPDAGLETWKARLVEKLRSSGHEWYGVQIVRVRPSK